MSRNSSRDSNNKPTANGDNNRRRSPIRADDDAGDDRRRQNVGGSVEKTGNFHVSNGVLNNNSSSTNDDALKGVINHQDASSSKRVNKIALKSTTAAAAANGQTQPLINATSGANRFSSTSAAATTAASQQQQHLKGGKKKFSPTPSATSFMSSVSSLSSSLSDKKGSTTTCDYCLSIKGGKKFFSKAGLLGLLSSSSSADRRQKKGRPVSTGRDPAPDPNCSCPQNKALPIVLVVNNNNNNNDDKDNKKVGANPIIAHDSPIIEEILEPKVLEALTGQHHRGHWSGQCDFLMSIIAYAVGLGNVWRFPYLCFKNGGGAFLIPYFLCWCIAAVPVFFMEVSIGQFLGEGGISVWNLCPIFRGVGIANTLIAIFCNIYFPVVVAWATFYVISSVATWTEDLPWQTCDRWWNDILCFDSAKYKNFSRHDASWTNATLDEMRPNDSQSPVAQFWEKRVLKTTDSIEETGQIQWELLLLLAFVWLLTYFALWKGITNSRKLIYTCAITPYVLLFILLARGLTLDGAWEGVKFYLKPNVSMLLKAEVWKDAGTQIFYSTGIGFGTLVALGSYNRYDHNVFRDSVILCVVNSMTSLLAGFVVFSVLGYMAHEAGKTVDQVVKSGVGLAFLVYPEAISTMPLPKLWSVLFFLMIMILGLDSLVCMVEGVVLSFTDQFPETLRQHKKMFLAALCFVGFLCGVPLVCQSGQFWLTLLDAYGASGISLLFVVFFEIIALSWVFGTKNIYRALEDMMKYKPSHFWHYCWKYTAPIVCVVIFAITVYDYTPIMYPDGQTPYPTWAMVIGFIFSTVSMLCIPAYAVYYLIQTPGTLKERFARGCVASIPLKFHNQLPTDIPIIAKNGLSRENDNNIPKPSTGKNSK